MKDQYNYYKNILEGERLPTAIVDLDVLDKNIESIVKRAKGKKIRVASKSIRCKSILKRILESHPEAFNGLMCFSPEEAVDLAVHGFDNLLVAYPYTRDLQLVRVFPKIKEGKNIILMGDLPEHFENYDRLAKKNGVVVNVCLDIDMSTKFPGIWFGVYRSSLRELSQLRKVLSTIKECPNLRLVGLMGYEAQIAGVCDSNPYTKLINPIIRLLKKLSINRIHKKRASMVQTCRDYGIELDFVNGGGTGSIESTYKDESVNEIAVGSGFFSPILFDYYKDFHYSPAAFYAIEVTRKSQNNIYTCAGGGYVASGSLGREKLPTPFLPEKVKLIPNEMAGEVQTPISYSGEIRIGDPVFFRHSKAGELCERFNDVLLVSNAQVIQRVPTYRGEGKCYL
ncbi:MAG: alanine racemase [Bacteriovoracaceae bacterium]|nr:alanine racemase [Bacteriovoracaceae bacterium]